jgi:hypothetical protein
LKKPSLTHAPASGIVRLTERRDPGDSSETLSRQASGGEIYHHPAGADAKVLANTPVNR